MELPDRDEWARKIGKAFAHMSDRHRAELRRLMGNPPDPRRVPESFWHEVREEAQAESIAALYLIFLASADFHAGEAGGELDDSITLRAQGWASTVGYDRGLRYAKGASDQFGRTAQKIFDAQAKQRETGLPPDEIIGLGEEALEEELAKSFGPARAGEMAESMTTQAQSAGGDAGINDTVGISQDDVWSVHPELTPTGPCPECLALDKQPRKNWAAINPRAADGQPLHDHCACTTEYANLLLASVTIG